tara:strand:- start:1605 stop:2552 length:948 start_codon:yes stop_codon:yes gene_type:complete
VEPAGIPVVLVCNWRTILKIHPLTLALFTLLPVLCCAEQEGETPAQQDGPSKKEEADPKEEKEEAQAAAMERGNALFSKGRHKQALAEYEAVLALDPDAEGALFNAGLTAYLTDAYRDALRHWTRLEKLDPSDWTLQKKLIQTHQALGDAVSRDARIKKLYALRSGGKNAKLAAETFFCRDQFKVGHFAVFSYEHFELKGERAVRIYFVVEDMRTRNRDYHLSLGSYAMTNAVYQQRLKEEGKPPQRLYHLDGYQGLNHETWQFYAGEPDYDLVRKHVREALEVRIAREKEDAPKKDDALKKEDAPKKDNAPKKD